METKKFILLYFICLVLTFANAYVTTLSETKEPQTVKITSIDYKLLITTSEADYESDDKNLGFHGAVIIDLKFEKPISERIQVSLDIFETTEIFYIKVYQNETRNTVVGFRMNGTHLILTSLEKLDNSASLSIQISFKNLYGNDLSGFYRSYYVDENKKKRWLLTTQLEATYARKVFPCFDKPSMKATFEVSIEIPEKFKEYDVFCNTPLQLNSTHDGKKLFQFKKTILPMPTYLVAFTVSDFKCTEKEIFHSSYPNSQQSERYIWTCGRNEFIKNNESELSQKTAKDAINELTKYLNLGYAFEKIHQVGIPDFSFGAMENWGHISYRETRLFFDKSKDSTLTKQKIVLIIAHELVHQWFGNLVTLQSWDYIWLNEAFANYLSYKIADEVKEPKEGNWNYTTQFLVDEIHLKAFEADGFSSSTPLTYKIMNDNFVMSYFNDIPYAKGAAVLRMWEHWLGEKNFTKSLQQYISDNANITANPSDLFNAFKKIGNMDDKFFKSWHEQAGYPVVEVKKINNTHYSFSQHRFLWEKSEKNFDTIWVIPLFYFTSESSTPEKFVMDSNQTHIEIKSKWFILNSQQKGYYRVNYEKEHWEALGDALQNDKFSGINEFNRAQIINDVFSLARSVNKNYVDYGTALALTKFLKNDTSLIVWKTALDSMKFVQLKLAGNEEMSEKFKSHVLELLKQHFKSLKNTGKSHTEKLFLYHINHWACSLNLENCTKEAEDIYKEGKIEPDLEETVYCTVIRKSDSNWQKIFDKYKSEEKSARKLMYLSALGCTDNNQTAESFLNKTLDNSSEIRQQDRLQVFLSVCENNIKNIEIAFKFIENNYKKIVKEYGGINALGKALKILAEKLNDKKDLERFKILTDNLNGLVPKDSIESAIHTLNSNVKWAKEKLNEIEDYLNAGSYSTISLGLLSLCSLLIYNL